jgi:hypothetical protein
MSSALQLISNTALSWQDIRIYSFVIPVSCEGDVSSNLTEPFSSETAMREFADISASGMGCTIATLHRERGRSHALLRIDMMHINES